MNLNRKDQVLFALCRRGDIESVRYLVESNEIELNVRDEWDSTPLYYACLCGHKDVVEYLLKNGARCEANTFDGERCYYAALNQRIKRMLKDYKAVTADGIRRDLFREFLRQCLDSPKYEDICFRVHGDTVLGHRIVLAARCPYMLSMLQTRWNKKSVISLNHPMMKTTAMKSLLQYIYTGRVDIRLDDVDGLLQLCKQCRMENLKSKVNDAVNKFHTYADLKPSTMRDRVSVINIEPERDCTEIEDDFAQILECSLPSDLRDMQFPHIWPDIWSIDLSDQDNNMHSLLEECSSEDESRPLYSDICFIIDGLKFYCHQVFVSGRSEYFKALIHFHQSAVPKNDEDILQISLNDIGADVFAAVLNFIYTDRCEIPETILLDLLYFSDLFLLPGLKRLCSRYLTDALSPNNVINFLRLARLYGLSKLELDCCEYIADHLDQVAYLKEFQDLVKEDASDIRARQETDSIEIVDDIRFHLHSSALPGILKESQGDSSLSTEEKLHILEEVLQSLNIDV